MGHDHDLDLRLRRAGLRPDRPRQRNEQQLVVREHPRDQSVCHGRYAPRYAIRHGADRRLVRARLPTRGHAWTAHARRGRAGTARAAKRRIHDGARGRRLSRRTEDGYEIKATQWHDFYTTRGKLELRDLLPGDELLVQSGKGQFGREGSAELGLLLGLITGDGHFTNRGKGQDAAQSSTSGARIAALADRVAPTSTR